MTHNEFLIGNACFFSPIKKLTRRHNSMVLLISMFFEIIKLRCGGHFVPVKSFIFFSTTLFADIF